VFCALTGVMASCWLCAQLLFYGQNLESAGLAIVGQTLAQSSLPQEKPAAGCSATTTTHQERKAQCVHYIVCGTQASTGVSVCVYLLLLSCPGWLVIVTLLLAEPSPAEHCHAGWCCGSGQTVTQPGDSIASAWHCTFSTVTCCITVTGRPRQP
jgi:hypothetical protein